MNVSKAIKARASTRAFLMRPIDKKIIEAILETARFAASGKNTQPWLVAVTTGKTQASIRKILVNAHQSEEEASPDDEYYADHYLPHHKKRAFACGMALYQALGIERDERDKRLSAWQRNYEFFDAPVGLFFFIEQGLAKGSWLDLGIFIQNIMLTALDHNLATCPQAALAEYPKHVKSILGAPYEDKILVCGMSLGYPDATAPVNNYRTEREPVDAFTRWFD